ncbi:hypothetical protein [Rariglobus hedericola]|uniref:Glycosyltransferase RgtA/B/C/D-like domain-containing protein n=1 Tax=Rariglobus hedericola TaxID=2597822 RepID=A0A556QRU6_9BACT|nr:hypothetical protein [Rariglobus hedericola]TSJ79358.1 hypothetical protein FPL22_08730 [Rariglobus hedericola]
MVYDDEGYVLISLRDFGTHGSLYNQVYSQYGPAFYLIYDTLHRLLGFAWNNTTGRWITLFNWTCTAFFCALLVRRARGSWPAVFCVFSGAFSFLWIMAREPMHPGSTIALIVAATAWLGWEMLRTGRINGFGIVTGVAGALLALIKINVGVFLILSSVFWLILSLPADRGRQHHILLGALGLLLPMILMQSRIADGWVQTFAAVSGLSIAGAILAVTSTAQRQPAGLAAWGWLVGAGITVVVTATGLLLPRDTNLTELWHGVIVAPLKHPGVYAFSPTWFPGTIWTAIGAVGLLLIICRLPHDHRITQSVAWIKILATIAYVFFILRDLVVAPSPLAFNYGLPLAGLFAWPLDREKRDAQPANQARAWLALLLVFQSLHAFPVAGSQLTWGVFLWIPLMALGFEEAVNNVSLRLPSKIGGRAQAALLVCMIALSAYLTLSFVKLGDFARDGGEALEQPGAEQIYMPANYSSALRIISENARVHGDMLFSLPGSYSFNLWSGLETPTMTNATHWFSLLTEKQQIEIIGRLEAAKRPILVVQQMILSDLIQSGFRPHGLLMDYLRNHFRRCFTIEGTSFWVRKGRSIAPVSTATVSTSADTVNLALILAPHEGKKVSRAELWIIVEKPQRKLTLDASQTKVTVTPLNVDGTVSGPTHAVDWPWTNNQIARITLTFSTPSKLPPDHMLEVILYADNGQRLASARIIPDSGAELATGNRVTP